uniref:Uncharacterized protein n=1 Tax=Plectus sambesii TaxID=2011161 RepID=A0A914X720_9BILA
MRDLVERMVVGDGRGLLARQLGAALSEQSQSTSDAMHRLSKSLPADDDASWLDVQEKDLPNGFDAAFAKETADMFADILSSDAASRPKKLARKVRGFITEGSGPVEGAEFNGRAKDKSANGINFDADMFGDSLNKILSLDGVHDKEPYASPSDSDVSYGDETLDIDLNEAPPLKTATDMKVGLREYMRQMDRELFSTNVGAGFERRSAGGDSIDEEDEDDFRPVDIDKNLVGNLLRSYWSEAGCSSAGPASTLLHGVRLAQEEQLDSDDEEDIS